MEYEFDFDNAIPNLDNVPDDLKHFYAQGDGGYRVAKAMEGAAKRINGLGTNLKTERSKKTQANNEAAQHRTGLAGFKSIVDSIADLDADSKTPDGLKNYIDGLIAKAAKGGEKGAEAARQLEAVKAEMARDKAAAIKVVTDERDAMQTSLFKYMVGDVANTALVEHKGNPLFLRPHIDRLTKVVKQDDGSYAVRVLDDKGDIRYNGEGNPMTVPELVVTLKKDDRFAAAFEGRVQGGGGTGHSKKTTGAEAERGGQKTDGTSMIARGLKARQAAR